MHDVRKALDAATRQLCYGADGEDCDRCVSPVHCDGSAWMRPALAAAIAAFLRALPSRPEFPSAEYPGEADSVDMFDAWALAAAVEAAAKEERRG